MSDDLRIPAAAGRAPISSSYRARRVGPEPSMRAITIAAAALGGVFLVGLGTYAVMHRHPAVVPLIEADSRPLRVRPDNPGGMQIAGAEEQGTGDGTDAKHMAPAPETPAPQALRAQMQQPAASPTAPPTALVAPPPAPTSLAANPPSAAPAATIGPSPLPDTPIPANAPPASARAAPTQQKPASGALQVQLAALDSESAVQAEWQRLSKRMPDLLGDRRLSVQKAERDGHPIWRLRTGGFADVADATGFCTKIRAKGANCTIASF